MNVKVNKSIRLDESLIVKVKKIKEEDGLPTWTAALAVCISGYYNKRFPAYVANKMEKARIEKEEADKTPEERCIEQGGTITTGKDGITPMCEIRISASTTRKVPLSMPENF